MWSTVEEFRDWYMSNGMPIRPPFKNPVFNTDNAMSLCLYREGHFQVELYLTEPHSTSPKHTHPGVESAFVYLAGNIQFNLEGRDNPDVKEWQVESPNGTHSLFGKTVSSPDGIPHWLGIGPEGGAFLSFEYWKDQEPLSVTVNWNGDSVGKEHDKILNKEVKMSKIQEAYEVWSDEWKPVNKMQNHPSIYQSFEAGWMAAIEIMLERLEMSKL
jgi:hypothetical protein